MNLIIFSFRFFVMLFQIAISFIWWWFYFILVLLPCGLVFSAFVLVWNIKLGEIANRAIQLLLYLNGINFNKCPIIRVFFPVQSQSGLSPLVIFFSSPLYSGQFDQLVIESSRNDLTSCCSSWKCFMVH